MCVHVLSRFSPVQLFAALWAGSLPGSCVCAILQARTLEWVAVPSSRGSSRPGDRTHISHVSCVGGWILYHSAMWEAQICIPHHLPI